MSSDNDLKCNISLNRYYKGHKTRSQYVAAMANDVADRQKPSTGYSSLAPEIRLKIIHLLLESEPSRVIDLQPPMPPAMKCECVHGEIIDIFPSPRPQYPVTLHINKECRFETLRQYKLAVQAIWHDDRKFFSKPTHKGAYSPKPRQSTEPYFRYHLCYNPSKDIFRIKENFYHWYHQFIFLNPGAEDHIRTVQIDYDVTLSLPGHHLAPSRPSAMLPYLRNFAGHHIQTVQVENDINSRCPKHICTLSRQLTILPYLRKLESVIVNSKTDYRKLYRVTLYMLCQFRSEPLENFPKFTLNVDGVSSTLEIESTSGVLGIDGHPIPYRIGPESKIIRPDFGTRHCRMPRSVKRMISDIARDRGQNIFHWDGYHRKLGSPLKWKDAEMGIPEPFLPAELPCPIRRDKGGEMDLCCDDCGF
ncbi:hypothetical protein HYALB_00007243 [Hymenoscyphus albidus]|uniref:2EXR domain-containing protein n=1 Tax=Hymenoscyphus albidus TaxID=595503 RepID=A0A9N9Q355_9HELO|nr:hypothetical protein HYALB_00007243 [Hymenoscyphus albidus]